MLDLQLSPFSTFLNHILTGIFHIDLLGDNGQFRYFKLSHRKLFESYRTL